MRAPHTWMQTCMCAHRDTQTKSLRHACKLGPTYASQTRTCTHACMPAHINMLEGASPRLAPLHSYTPFWGFYRVPNISLFRLSFGHAFLQALLWLHLECHYLPSPLGCHSDIPHPGPCALSFPPDIHDECRPSQGSR
jgi:hypothetical protein